MPNAKVKPPEKLSNGAGISFLRLKLEPIKAITNPVARGLSIKLSPRNVPVRKIGNGIARILIHPTAAPTAPRNGRMSHKLIRLDFHRAARTFLQTKDRRSPKAISTRTSASSSKSGSRKARRMSSTPPPQWPGLLYERQIEPLPLSPSTA